MFRLLSFLAAICLFGTVACSPEGDDPTPDPSENNTTSMNNSATTTNNGGEPEPANCDVVSVVPASLALDQPEHSLEVSFACDGEFPPTRLGESLDFESARTRELAGPLTVTSNECVPGQGDIECTVVLEGLQAPLGETDDNLGLETLTFEDQLGFSFRVPIRWALSPQQVAARAAGRDVTPLPPKVSERVLDLRVRQTEAGRIVGGAMRTQDGSGIELFTFTAGSLTVHETITFDPADTGNWGVSFALVSGAAELDWWGYDATEGVLVGHSVVVDAGGAVQVNAPLDTSDFQAVEITELLGVTYQVGAAPGGVRATGRALVKTSIGSVAVLGLGSEFQPDSLVLVNQFDALGRTPATQLVRGEVGLTIDNAPSATTEPYIWRVNEDQQFSLYSLAGAELGSFLLQLTDVQWPFVLNSVGTTERHFVFGLTPEGATEPGHMLAVWTGQDDPVLGRAEQLTLPSVCRPTGRVSFFATTPTQFGQLCTEEATGTSLKVEWDLSERVVGARDAAGVTPLVRQSYTAPSSGDQVVVGLLADGTLAVDRVADTSASCDALGDCAQPVTGFSRKGWRLNMVPGVTSPAWAVDKYGDILIDGVPLVFDLTQPPVIVDAPGAAGQDVGAFVVAGIDHEDGTHAVWRVEADGSMSSAGLLQLGTNDPNTEVALTNAVSEGADGGTIVFAVELVSSGLGGEPASGVGGTLEVGVAALNEAIDGDAPVPFSTESDAFALATAGARTVVLAPVDSAPYSFSDSSDLKLMQQLSDAQGPRPLVVTHDEGGLSLRSSGDDGDDPLDALLDQEPVGNDNPIFIDTGSSGENALNAKQGVSRKIRKVKRRREQDAKRVRRVRLKSFNADAGPPEPTSCVILTESELPPSVEGDEFVVLETGDYNGDGVGDVMLRRAGESGAILVFSDGRGGFADESLELPGGPGEVFVRALESNGKGTRRAAASIKQNIALDLL